MFHHMMSDYLKPLAAIILPNLGGIAGGFLTKNEVRSKNQTTGPTWYQALKKPALQPPSWIFGPVWTGLYCSMGYASYLIWRDGDGFSGDAALPLACYGTQLALNWAWTPIFFKFHNLRLATITIGTIWGGIVATMVTFHKVNPTAAYMLIPYLGWVSFASYLTFSIWRNNKDRTD